jgi:hypothetical protein
MGIIPSPGYKNLNEFSTIHPRFSITGIVFIPSVLIPSFGNNKDNV